MKRIFGSTCATNLLKERLPGVGSLGWQGSDGIGQGLPIIRGFEQSGRLEPVRNLG